MFKGIPGIALFAGIGIGFPTAALVTACANQAPVKSLVSAESTLLPWKTQHRNAESFVDPNDGESFAELLSELEGKRVFFEMHGEMTEYRFRSFVEVQLLWDEHMASVAGDYLRSNPEKALVILAGSGHVAFPDAIPGRLARLEKVRQAVVVTGSEANNPRHAVDFFLAERDIELEPPGRLGMMLATEDAGVRIREVPPASPAEKAGFLPGHRIHSIAGESVRSMQDVRLALLDRMPGHQVWVEIEPGAKPNNGGTQGRGLTLL